MCMGARVGTHGPPPHTHSTLIFRAMALHDGNLFKVLFSKKAEGRGLGELSASKGLILIKAEILSYRPTMLGFNKQVVRVT